MIWYLLATLSFLSLALLGSALWVRFKRRRDYIGILHPYW